MTPNRFREGRHLLGLSQAQLARLFRIKNPRTIRKWEAGENDIAGPAQVLLNWLAFGKKPDIDDAKNKPTD